MYQEKKKTKFPRRSSPASTWALKEQYLPGAHLPPELCRTGHVCMPPLVPVNWPQASSSTRWGQTGSWSFSCPQLSVLGTLKRSAMSNSAWRMWFPKRWAFCGNWELRHILRTAPSPLNPQADSPPPEVECASGIPHGAPLLGTTPNGSVGDSPSQNLRTCWKHGRT